MTTGLPSDGIDMTALAHIVPSLSSRICSRILAADRPTRFGTCGARAGETSRALGGQIKEIAGKAGDGWKNFLEAGRDQLEERGHALRTFGDDVRRNFGEPTSGAAHEARPPAHAATPHAAPQHAAGDRRAEPLESDTRGRPRAPPERQMVFAMTSVSPLRASARVAE